MTAARSLRGCAPPNVACGVRPCVRLALSLQLVWALEDADFKSAYYTRNIQITKDQFVSIHSLPIIYFRDESWLGVTVCGASVNVIEREGAL